MEKNKKFLLLAIAASVLVVLVAAAYWLFNYKQSGKNKNLNSVSAVEVLPESVVAVNQAAVNAELTPEQQTQFSRQEQAKAAGRNFFERYTSFSKADNWNNLKVLAPEMTEKMAKAALGYQADMEKRMKDFSQYGAATKVLVNKLMQDNAAAGTAEISLEAQQTINTVSQPTTKNMLKVTIKLLRVNDRWLVDEIVWG